jgi:signal transduction histidine kinase
VEAAAVVCGIRAVMANQQSEFRLEYPCHSPREQRWFLMRVTRFGEEGPVRLVVAHENITDRVQAEQERRSIEVQLRHAQKLESIGQLAAGIAHEINTPTQYIGDNTKFVRDSFIQLLPALRAPRELLAALRENRMTPELLLSTEAALEAADLDYLSEELPKAMDESLQGVDRVAKIVRAMKEFSHPGSSEKTQVNLNHAIESTLTVARNEWKYVAEMVTDFDPQLPPVTCLPGEFNQVILNLVVNAAHAINDTLKDRNGKKGTITVSTKRDGEWVEVRVRDTGTGIPESARGKMFEPFFTTKAVGKGTGQGLAIARSVVVDKHGGTISFETETGKGTVFIIRLPVAAPSPK